MSKILKIYTDGCCKGNPGPGGWGAILSYGEHRKEIYGGEKETTNNRMELLAVIRGLDAVKKASSMEVYSDSSYVINGISKWIHGWKRNGWRTSDKKPVKNADLWQKLDAMVEIHEIEWIWVKGHAGHKENERADYLANLGVKDYAK